MTRSAGEYVCDGRERGQIIEGAQCLIQPKPRLGLVTGQVWWQCFVGSSLLLELPLDMHASDPAPEASGGLMAYSWHSAGRVLGFSLERFT